jgi:glycerol-3-phosphate dehydrogenase
VVFAIPFEQQYTLVGTTDLPFTGDPSRVSIDAAERDYLLECVNRFFKRSVTIADIVSTYSGVRPLFDDGSGGAAQQVSRDYHLELQHGVGNAPVITVYGGKITTYRRLAEAALAILLPTLDQTGDGEWTAGKALPGGDMPAADLRQFSEHSRQRWPAMPAALVNRLARLYGTRMARILGGAQCMQDLGTNFGGDLTLAEVRYLVTTEWARSAEDILWRRTRLGMATTDSAVHQLQDAVAQLLR